MTDRRMDGQAELLVPSPGPRGAGQKKCAVAHPIHVNNLHTKFGWNSSNGLGVDSMTVGRTDGRTEAITISPSLFLKKRGDNDEKRLVYQQAQTTDRLCNTVSDNFKLQTHIPYRCTCTC